MTTVPTNLGPIFVDDRGGPGRPVALLWPSLFTDHSMWDAQVAALADAGWRTIAIDPPSHGLSPGPDRPFSMNECADAAIEVLDALGILEPVVVFGTSWGGFVAPRVALRAPDRVRGLVLFATSADAPMVSQRLKASLLAALFPFDAAKGFVDRVNLSHLLSASTIRDRPGLADGISRSYRSWDRGRLLVAIRSVLLRRAPVIDDLAGVSAPALVVSGSDDDLLPPTLGRRIADRIPGARFVVVEDAAHLIPLERPETANRLIAEFLADLPSAGPGLGS